MSLHRGEDDGGSEVWRARAFRSAAQRHIWHRANPIDLARGAWPKKRPAWHFQPLNGEPQWTDREARPEFGSCISRASRGKCVTASCHLCLVIFTSCHVICCWFIARRPLLSTMAVEPKSALPRSGGYEIFPSLRSELSFFRLPSFARFLSFA